MKPIPDNRSNDQKLADALRADKAQARSDRLIAVCAKWQLTLPRNAMEWRSPAKPTFGTLPSFNCEAELLCTDGIVAWFEVGGRPFFGHLAAFEATPEEKTYAGPRKKSKAKRLEELLDML